MIGSLYARAMLIAAGACACTPQAALELSGLHENDQWSWRDYQGTPMLDIQCPFGIGSLSLHAERGWPDNVIFNMRSSGLENFSVTIAGRRYQLEVNHVGTTLYAPDSGNLLSLLPASPSIEKPAYLVRIDLSLVPTEVDSIFVSWVDFYR